MILLPSGYCDAPRVSEAARDGGVGILDASSGCGATGGVRGSKVGGSTAGITGAARGVAGDSKETGTSLGVNAPSSAISDAGSSVDGGVGVISSYGDGGAKSVAGGCVVRGGSSVTVGAGANESAGFSSV